MEVLTPLGRVRGAEADGCRSFLGLPFAQPPVGARRFRPPSPPLPWQGVRAATRCAPVAMQPGDSYPQSEDCLYLNVVAPAGKGPYPVLVWIHGGGFTGGRACDPLCDGAQFARDGVVCVNIAYRLGVFGFLDVAPLLGAEYAGSAVNAMRDVIAALEWVQKNIAAFGGDPTRVTVGGQSAGAKMTDLLMGVPSAKGLFHQMISESGGAERIWPMEQAQKIATSFGEMWNATTGDEVKMLLKSPASTLISAQGSFYREPPVHFPLRCEIDGQLFPGSPLEAIRGGSTRGKRLLLGTNREESASFIGPHPEHDPGPSDLGNLSVDVFSKVAEHYAQVYPGMSDDLRRVRSTTAEEYWIPSLRVAEAHVTGGGAAFVYRFDDAVAKGRFAGEVPHTHELPLVWDQTKGLSADDALLAHEMHATWVAFIKGDALSVGGTAWPRYDATRRPTILLQHEPVVEDRPADAEYHLWDGLLTR
nr:carboxylesterase family protein [Bryocella elongata]